MRGFDRRVIRLWSIIISGCQRCHCGSSRTWRYVVRRTGGDWHKNPLCNGDLCRAFAAATSAVKSDANAFHFRETGGQICLKLGSWQETIDDREFSVKGLPSVPGICAALAKTHASIGNEQLAAKHRQTVHELPSPPATQYPHCLGYPPGFW